MKIASERGAARVVYVAEMHITIRQDLHAYLFYECEHKRLDLIIFFRLSPMLNAICNNAGVYLSKTPCIE